MLEARDEQGLVDAPAPCSSSDLQAVVGAPPLELPVERREALLGNFSRVGALDVDLSARSKLLGRQLRGAPAHAGRDVAPRDPQLAPIAVNAADDDVRVRMAR